MTGLDDTVHIPESKPHKIAMACMAVRYRYLKEVPPHSSHLPAKAYELTAEGKKLLLEGPDETD